MGEPETPFWIEQPIAEPETHHMIIQNWDMNLHKNLEESVICSIFYTVVLWQEDYWYQEPAQRRTKEWLQRIKADMKT